VSVILTYGALGAAFGLRMGTCHWFGGEVPGLQKSPAPRLLGFGPEVDPQWPMIIAFIGWLGACGLHFYASRRRRMNLLHGIAPIVMLLLCLAWAFGASTVCI